MRRFSRAVLCRAGVLPSVLDHHVTDVDVADDVTVDRHVLPDYEPGIKSKIDFSAKRTRDPALNDDVMLNKRFYASLLPPLPPKASTPYVRLFIFIL